MRNVKYQIKFTLQGKGVEGKERKVITKAILKDAVAKGLSDAEIAKLVREM